jgi:hypothetical protein
LRCREEDEEVLIEEEDENKENEPDKVVHNKSKEESPDKEAKDEFEAILTENIESIVVGESSA